MNSPRVLVFTPEVWPIVTDQAMEALRWCSALKDRGLDVVILTCRWDRMLPERTECRELVIHRLLPPMTSLRRTVQLIDQAGKWLRGNSHDFDSCIIHGPLDFISQCAERWRVPLPLVARLSGSIVRSRTGMQHLRSSRLHVYDRVVCPDDGSLRVLTVAGFGTRALCLPIPSWVSSEELASRRRQARETLVRLSPEFGVDSESKLVVCLGDLSAASGSGEVIDAAISLLNRGEKVCFWFSGFDRENGLYSQLVRDHAWHHEIIIGGPFDEIDDLVHAADLIVLPHSLSRECFIEPFVLGSGQAFVVPESSPVTERESAIPTRLIYQRNRAALVAKIKEWMEHRDVFDSEAASFARKFLLQHHPSIVLDGWLRLLSANSARRTG